MILPVLMYGSEVWALTKKSQKKLITFENKILRRIFGPVQEGDIWRIRKNRELREIYQDPDVIALIRSKRMRWMGHVARRGKDKMIKKVWRGEPEGVRPLGRPRMRWRDQVEKDLRTIGATLEVAQDRGSWRDIVGEVKNHLGFEWPQE
uniref:Endonuclease-reverse transcriptase n=1 Tax=Homalodisca liturata TaxID=320908 RepID=A0A1B6HHE4_9HEMI